MQKSTEIFQSQRLPKLLRAEFMVLTAHPESVKRVRNFVGIDLEMGINAVLAASELAANAVKYGTPEQSSGVFVAGIIYTNTDTKLFFVGDSTRGLRNQRIQEKYRLVEGGEGMKIVERVSKSAHVTHVVPPEIKAFAPDTKKIVYFEPTS